MQRLGLLTEILPEFGKIDSLVVRDFYHRYTVDEHSLRTNRAPAELAEPPDEPRAHFRAALEDRRAAGFADPVAAAARRGQRMQAENHITAASARSIAPAAVESFAGRERRSPLPHRTSLDMSATVQRRDIFDPAPFRLLRSPLQRWKGCKDCAC